MDYPTHSARTTLFGKNYYLKHKIIKDEIKNSYVCFIYNNGEHCLTSSSDKSAWPDNKQEIMNYQAYHGLETTINAATNQYGCYYTNSNAYCYGGTYHKIISNNIGLTSVSERSETNCYVPNNGSSYCFDYTNNIY